MSCRILLLLSCLALLGTACSPAGDPVTTNPMTTAPALEAVRIDIATTDGQANHYPLALGTTWTYDVVERTRFRADGDLEFGPWKTTHYERRERAARNYKGEWQDYVETDIVYWSYDHPNPEYPYVSHQRLRQDAVALYSTPITGGIGAVEPTARDLPAPVRAEHILLVYPTHVGAHWKPSPLATTELTVEAIEPVRTVLGVLPAARVGGTWYGKVGVVRRLRHIIGGATEYPRHGVREEIDDELLTSFTPG
jgi:hypothetical protein